MMKTSARRATALCALLAATSLAGPLAAQTSKQDALPSEQYAVSPGGVDMRTGQYTYSHTDLAIGGTTGMALVRDNGANDLFVKKPFGNFAHNWEIYVNEKHSGAGYNQDTGQTSDTSYHISVTAGGRSHSFTAQYLTAASATISSNTAFARMEQFGTNSGRYYRYTAADGTIIQFRPTEGRDCTFGIRSGRCAYAEFLRQPDGLEYVFAYESLGAGNGARLRRVTSNLGHALILEYSTAAGQQRLVSKACLLNLAVTTAPTAHVCPSGARTASYAYLANGHLASYTDPTGAMHGFGSTWSNVAATYDISFSRPGETAPYLVNRIERTDFYEATTKQTFADGRVFDYAWAAPIEHNELSQELAGGSWTRNGAAGATIAYQTFTWPLQKGRQVAPGPSTITDALGRTTTGNYCWPHQAQTCVVGPVRSWTLPEGNSIHYGYDGYRNITETRRKAKPGSGLADTVTAAGFDCSAALNCAKPQWTEDARGNRTVYTYDGTHGGVLTETGPAVNGIAPQKRYAYEQRTARLANGAAAGTAVWLLVRESFCKKGAAAGNGCQISGDEVVTTYDYGPASSPNNLQLRGKVVDAGGLNLRSCFGFDAFGNKISETAPKAGLSSCQ